MWRPYIFGNSDVTPAARAVLAAGVNVARVEANPRAGMITVMLGQPGKYAYRGVRSQISLKVRRNA